MLEKHYDGKGFMRSFFPYTREVINGELGYDLPELLFTPGTSAIAIVEAIANRVFGLEIGQKLFCDPYIYSLNVSAEPDGIVLGWTGVTGNCAFASSDLERIYRNWWNQNRRR